MFTQDMKELVGRDGDATKASPKVSVAASAEGSLAQGTPSNVDKNKKDFPKKALVKKPKGMSRELYDLLIRQGKEDKIVSFMQSGMTHGYSSVKAQIGRRKVHHWKSVPFTNEGRKDGLQLVHWEREDRRQQVYPFAKFSKSLEVPQFDMDEYELWLRHPLWTYEETAHLMDLCQRFDLRWPIIADRYDRYTYDEEKTMEDLKERYYAVEHDLAVQRHRSPPELSYDAEHEKRRKEQLCRQWNRTEEQVKEEEELIAAIKRIEMKRKERERKAQEVQRLINVADRTRTSLSPESSSAYSPGGRALGSRGRSSLVKSRSSQSAAAQLLAQPDTAAIKWPEYRSAGPHLRSSEMKLPTGVGQKKMKNIDTVVSKLKIPPWPHAHEAIIQQFNDYRSQVVLLQELKGALQTAEGELEILQHRLHTEKRKEVEIPARIRVPDGEDVELTPDQMATSAEEAEKKGLPTTKRRIAALIDTTGATSGRKRRPQGNPSPQPDNKRSLRP